jgi:hypothetical protein
MKPGIYITIPKTGQTSLMKYFETNYTDSIMTIDTCCSIGREATFDFSKSTAQFMKEKLSPEQWNNSLTFCFVRNPWDRYVSNWQWLTRNCGSGRGWNARGFIGQEGKITFRDFVFEVQKAYNIRGKFYQHDRWHIWNQLDHITDIDGNIMIDRVLKFENLKNDLTSILEELSLSITEDIPHLNYKGFYENEPKLKHKPHYSVYYDDELIEIVRQRCQPDISAFNYSFEDNRHEN